MVRSQTVFMRIAWRRQHQFSLITAVQAGRETGGAIAIKGDEMQSPDLTLKAAFFNREVGQKTNNTKILLRMDELKDIQN